MVKGLGFRISQYLFSQFKLFSCLGSTCLHVIDHTCIWKPQQQYRWKLKMNEWFKIIAMSTYMFNTTKGVGQSFGLRRIGWLVSMPTFELYGFKGTIFPPHSPPKLVPNVPNHIHSLRRFIKIFVSNGVPNFVHHASVIISRENNIQMSTMLLKTAWCEKNDQKLVFMLLYFVFFLVIVLMSFSCGETSWMSKDTISPSRPPLGTPDLCLPSWLALDSRLMLASQLMPTSRLAPDFRLSLMFLTHPRILDSHLPSWIARGLPSAASLRQILHSKCFITGQLLVGKVFFFFFFFFFSQFCNIAVLAILHKEELAKFGYRRGK